MPKAYGFGWTEQIEEVERIDQIDILQNYWGVMMHLRNVYVFFVCYL